MAGTSPAMTTVLIGSQPCVLSPVGIGTLSGESFSPAARITNYANYELR